MTLPQIKEIINILKFAKKSFTKGGFRHVQIYVNGLISLARKSVKKIAEASKINQQSLNYAISKAKFEKEKLEKRYLKKLKYLFKKFPVYLIIDDTLVERNGKKVEEAQHHFDHNEKDYVKGHQFFTSLLYTPFLQMPLFPNLYSSNTDSKIEMAKNLIEKLSDSKIKIDTILFDSWYSDEKLIKKSISKKIRVIGAVKSNRKIMPPWKQRWISLSFISDRIRSQKLIKHEIKGRTYEVWSTKARLNKFSQKMKLIISQEIDKENNIKGTINLISSDLEDQADEIIRTYKLRWKIETFHRDIKQNLSFAKVFFRRREGIIRHSILATIAYAVLALFMYRVGKQKTIGECCEYLRDKSTTRAVHNLVVINNKQTRLSKFEEVFL